MSLIVLADAYLIDGTGRDPVEGAAVVVEGSRIREVLPRWTGTAPTEGRVLSCRGQTLLPGLSDAHAHVTAVEPNLLEQHRRLVPSGVALRGGRVLEEALRQGFTTLRDAGGADWGMREAVRRGVVAGPRLLISAAPLSQTGGHGDYRQRAETVHPEPCVGMRTVLADGVAAVRRASREQLRQGADFLKLVVGGGVLSPSDELESTQYSEGEIRAAVEEATAVGTYVAAHVYGAPGIARALAAGVRSIEHGNLLDAPTAAALRTRGAYLVPTLATFDVLWRHRDSAGLSAFTLAKLGRAREGARRGLELAARSGCRVGSGSDLLGPFQRDRALELVLRAEILSPMAVLVAATRTNAELFGLGDRLGTVEPGKWADLIVVAGDPLRDLGCLRRYDETLSLVMKAGTIYVNRLA